MQRVFKDFDTLKLDFNSLTNVMSEGHYQSKQSSKYLDEYILQGTVVVKNIHTHDYFKNIINKIIETNNLHNKKIDVDLYVGFTQGAASNIHVDNYDVYLYSLYGRTIYVVNKENYLLDENGLINIKKGEIHQAIGLSPRITLSVGVYDY